jgi:undecaprenyl-diphosphatase
MAAIIHAIILGIVEGLTEFLPISSTGHLIVAERVVGYKDAAQTFTIVVQLGAIAAVAWYYKKDLWNRLVQLCRGSKKAQKFWINLIIATVPAGAVGLLLDKTMERYSVPVTVAVALVVGGFVLLYAESKLVSKRQASALALDDISSKQALGVGVSQIVALIPGVSRSGATIVGGMFAGLNRTTAAAFSFYMSLPILGLASVYKLVKAKDTLGDLPGGASALLVGVVAAFVSALFVVSWLLTYISRHNFKVFAYYRIIFGVFLLILIAANVL